MHAGEEGVAPGGAALLGIIRHEHRTLISDAIDVRRFPDHQTPMIDARLHPADVVTHDEENVGLLRELRGSGRQAIVGGRCLTTDEDRPIQTFLMAGPFSELSLFALPSGRATGIIREYALPAT